MHLAVNSGVVQPGVTVFDYGCGRGDDIRRLARSGITCDGWDPHFRPDTPRQAADVLNLGFVLNVIEDSKERDRVLADAWALTKRVLVVAVRTTSEAPRGQGQQFGDGLVTERATFQKFYGHGEFRSWIESHLDTQVVSVEPGIVFIFRDAGDREDFLARRVRQTRVARTRVRQADRLYDLHREAIDSLLEFFTNHGRAPRADEFQHPALLEELGSGPAAVNVLRRLVGNAQSSPASRWPSRTISSSTSLSVGSEVARDSASFQTIFGTTSERTSVPIGLRAERAISCCSRLAIEC